MAQHSLEQEFHRMAIHDPRKQLSPSIARKPQISSSVYRAGPAPYRGYHDNPDDFPPPPPPSQSYLENYPPPPPDPKENIYHEIQDDFPPPPPTGAPVEYRTPDPMHMRSSSGYNQTTYGGPGGSSYESRHESHTVIQPSGRYEREVKQATYSIQSSDSSGRSSPYGGQYGNLNTYSTSSMAQNPPPPVSQNYLSSSEAQPYSTTSLYDTSGQYGQYGSKSRNYSPYNDTQVTYAQIQSKSEPAGVTYAQIAPRADRPVPGPQVPIQIKVSDSRRSEPVYPASGQVQYQPSSLSPSGQQHVPAAPSYSQSKPVYSGQQQVPVAPPTFSQSKPVYSGGNETKSGSSKEEEVDALTQMLMQGLEGTKDPDFYGICAKCGKKVVGETNGCTAMDQVYHIACFICIGCGKLLRGESFYAMERKPFCEPCYVNSLEKCSVCSKPITDRLLRATGKPYHPACFTCVVCGKSLDGIPFTVDATNQIHCIEDFHKKFAPRCCVCHNPIMPEKGQEETVRVVAMDRSFHVGCYRCEFFDGSEIIVRKGDISQKEQFLLLTSMFSNVVGCRLIKIRDNLDCHMQLSSEAEGRGCYPLDDHILCKNCNAKRINALTTKLSTEL